MDRTIYVININDPEYPDTYKLCMRNKHPSKNSEIKQNGKYYDIVTVIKIPMDLDYKKIIRALTKKLPEVGKMKYNYTFHKDRLDEITEALKKKQNS